MFAPVMTRLYAYGVELEGSVAKSGCLAKCLRDLQRGVAAWVNSRDVNSAPGGDRARPVRRFKTLKTAYNTIKGFEVIRARRKGQAGPFALEGGIVGKAKLVERAFGLGRCALTVAAALLQDRRDNAES